MIKKTEPILEQSKMFIGKITPFDFTRNMGQYAVEITYTNGDTQMFTTNSTNPNVFSSYEFDDLEEMTNFIDNLKK